MFPCFLNQEMNGRAFIFIVLLLETEQDNDYLHLSYTFVKGLMMQKAFELTDPVTNKLFVTREVNGTTCVDIDYYIPDLQFISSLRTISGWLHAAGNLSNSTISSCQSGGESVRVPSEVLSIYNLVKTIQGSTFLSEVTNQMEKFVSVEDVSCDSVPVRNNISVADWVMETTFKILRMMETNCSTVPQFDFTPPSPDTPLPNNCLINAHNSARMYLSSPDRFITDLPMLPDICFGLKNTTTTSLTNLLPSAVSISDSGRLISIPSIHGPVHGPPETQNTTICPIEIRGNDSPCQGLDVWGCFSAAGCYVDWSSGNCKDCPAGFYCGDKGNEKYSCNAIPSDQSFTGIAWTDPDCPSKCTDPLYMMSGEKNCVKITSFGVYANPCDSSNLLPCLEQQDYYTKPFTVFPTMGSCRDSYLLNLVAVALNPPAHLLTISLWFNYSSYNTTLFGLAGNTLVVSTTASRQLNVVFLGGELLSLTFSIPQGWNHLICSIDGSGSLDLHINGMPVLTRTTTGVAPSPHIFIGPLLDNEPKLYSGIDIYDFQVFKNDVTPNAKILFASSSNPPDLIRPQQCMLGSEVSASFCPETTLNPTMWEIFNSNSQTTLPTVSPMSETTPEAMQGNEITETVHSLGSATSYMNPTTLEIIHSVTTGIQNQINATTFTVSETRITQGLSGDIESTTTLSMSAAPTEPPTDEQANPTTWETINLTDLPTSFIAGSSYTGTQGVQIITTEGVESTKSISPDQTTFIPTVILLTTDPPTSTAETSLTTSSDFSTTNKSDALGTTDDGSHATSTEPFPEITPTPTGLPGLVDYINSTEYISTSLTETSSIASTTISGVSPSTFLSTDEEETSVAFSNTATFSTASPSDDEVSTFGISTVNESFPTTSWILAPDENTIIATSCNSILTTMNQAIQILSTTLPSSSTESNANRSYTVSTKNNSSNAFADKAGQPPGLQTQNYLNHEPPLIESYKNLILIASCVTASLIVVITVGATLYMHLRRRMTRQVISV